MDLSINSRNNSCFACNNSFSKQRTNNRISISTVSCSKLNSSSNSIPLTFGAIFSKFFKSKKMAAFVPTGYKIEPRITVRGLYEKINKDLNAIIEECTSKIESKDFGASAFGCNQTYIKRAKAYAGLGNFDQALKDCCFAATRKNSDADVKNLLAKISSSSDLSSETECFAKICEIKDLSTQIAQTPKNVEEIYIARANSYLDLGLSDNAILDFRTAATLYKIIPNSEKELSKVYSSIGYVYLKEINAEEAIRYFKMAKRCDRQNEKAEDMYNALMNGYKFN